MTLRIAVGVSSFADSDATPMKMLEESGVEIIPNPYSRRMTEEEIIRHIDGIDGLLAGLEPLNRKVLKSASSLRAVARVGIGLDNVDLDTAHELNILVSNTPDGPTEAVAEMCLASLLTLSRRIVDFNTDFHSGIWKKHIGTGLRGTRVLLIGYGRIGRKFGEMLRFFGAEIMVYDPFISSDSLTKSEERVALEEGIARAEVISLHASGNETILNKEVIGKMQKGVILLNSARGDLINENALIDALESGRIDSVWLDVFWKEPYNGRLLEFSNVLLTPHVSTYTLQCRLSMEVAAVKNLLRDLELDN